MASVMVIGSEVFGSLVEGIRVEVGLKKAEALFALPCIFVDGLGGWACESFDCFVISGARY